MLAAEKLSGEWYVMLDARAPNMPSMQSLQLCSACCVLGMTGQYLARGALIIHNGQ